MEKGERGYGVRTKAGDAGKWQRERGRTVSMWPLQEERRRSDGWRRYMEEESLGAEVLELEGLNVSDSGCRVQSSRFRVRRPGIGADA